MSSPSSRFSPHNDPRRCSSDCLRLSRRVRLQAWRNPTHTDAICSRSGCPHLQEQDLRTARVEVLLADLRLSRPLQEDGTYTIVSDDTADAILNCTHHRSNVARSAPFKINVPATAEFGLFLDIAYRVSDRVTGSILKEGKVRGETTFLAATIFRRPSARQFPWLRLRTRPSH